jgi:hypothetical protein
MEPSTGTDPVASSLPKTCSAIELRGRVLRWAPRTRTWKVSGSKPVGSANSPSAYQSRPPVPTRVSPGTGGGPQPCAAAKCPRRELNPQHVAPQATASAIGLRGCGAAVRCRPGSSAVRRRSHSRVQRPSWSPWPRTRNLRGQSPAGLPIPLVTTGSDHHAGRSKR